MKLRFAPRAESDLAEIHDYIAGNDPTAAERARKRFLTRRRWLHGEPISACRAGARNS